MKRALLLGLGLITVGLVAAAEQLTTVAVIDINEVYTTFYRDSEAVRELQRLREQYQQEIDRHLSELEDLQQQRVEARDTGNDQRAEEISDEIYQKRQFIEDLTERRQRQLRQRQEQLISDDFLQTMQQAIQFVAENEGFTVVLSTEMEALQWWSPTVDITDLVLQRLRQTASP